MTPPVLEAIGLGRAFGASTVLQGIDVALEAGDRLAVIGASGSGKTTLLRLIAGLDAPTSGMVSIKGQAVSLPRRLVVPPERRQVAMVFQGLALLPHLRALEQIAFAAPGRDGRSRAQRLLERIGLADRAAAPLGELSGGERQRIALARALVQRPALLLMDEPFASLDDQRRDDMRSLLRSLLDETKIPLILVTHARDDAFILANRVMILANGRCVVADRIQDVLINPRHIAAVKCLGLGAVLRGRSTDGWRVDGDFGSITLSSPVRPGDVHFLIRPHQASITQGGPLSVRAIEVWPPNDDAELRRIAVVECGSGTVRVDVGKSAPHPGDRVALQIEGACMPIVHE